MKARGISGWILVMLVYAIGTLGVFSSYYNDYHRTSFQGEVKHSPRQDLEKLSFTDQEFTAIQWTEPEIEFELHGRMYDVSAILKTSSGYIILCENDQLEEMLLALIKGERKDSPLTKKGQQQPQFFNALLFDIPLTPGGVEQDLNPAASSIYLSYFPEAISPPPESAFA